MIRKGVSKFLMLAFITGQTVTLPHAHADAGQHADHDARPHAHVGCFIHDVHFHGDGHCHQHDIDDSHSHGIAGDPNTEHDEHDSDAVYLPDDLGSTLLSKVIRPIDHQHVEFTLAIVDIPAAASWTNLPAPTFSSNEWRADCPLWLALRALRI